ncbi:hypothetical protein LPW11_02805 [Geomonas sp. RF6]|uniref:hypothetical protein n=1 Tax=Geomonas sp. RF6 TaxID=2897342 RepID=UPI001E57B7D3|nr:hypothetical protein [Geomonas sp. RF6]UFS71129.1 hypothetical protein LPW11_02805 [Geomonas sp. RF6]
MKVILCSFLLLALHAATGCTASRSARTPETAKEKPVLVLPAVQVGKDWQVKEKAPDLTDERGRVSFQSEQSVQPPGAAPTTPPEQSIAPRQ